MCFPNERSDERGVAREGVPGARLWRRGKVRDVYEAGGDHLVMVASDRLSAFDVVLPTPIPSKGRVLTQMSNFWFNRLEDRPESPGIDGPQGLSRARSAR